METKIQEQKFQKSRNKSKKNPGTKFLKTREQTLPKSKKKNYKNLGTKLKKSGN
jgi:hypothetical protein